MRKGTSIIAVVVLILIVAAVYAQVPPPAKPVIPPGHPQAGAAYVGAQVCRGCHTSVYEQWLLSPHRRTLLDKQDGPGWRGCEGCHGPGGAHVAAGGGPGTIINLEALPPERTSTICLGCHNQKHVLLWKSGAHARSNLTCTNCHDPHMGDKSTMLKLVDGAQESVRGLNTAISDAQLAANSAEDEDVKSEYIAKLNDLRQQKNALEKQTVEYQSKIRRTEDPYLCLSCHQEVESQFRLPSHHPLFEDKIKCGDCHNPHGGRLKMLRGERQPETCYRCHAEVQGPFVFQHPPVAEDCGLCHRPHGSQYNNLLEQQDPFVCLKCHVGPHSRSNTFLDEKRTTDFYWRCVGCHNTPHGSDRQASFHL